MKDRPWERWRVIFALEIDQVQDVLNEQDNVGWELHKIFYRGGRYDIIFERRDSA